MAQNRKKGMAKRALSVSLVAAMLATSNTPAWASGFRNENEDGVQAFLNEISKEPIEESALLQNDTDPAYAFDDESLEAVSDAIDDIETEWDAVTVTRLNGLRTLANKVATAEGGAIESAILGFTKDDAVTDGIIDPDLSDAFVEWDGKVLNYSLVGRKLAVELKASEDAKPYYLEAEVALGASDPNNASKWSVTINANGSSVKFESGSEQDRTLPSASSYTVSSVSFTMRNGVTVSSNDLTSENVDLSDSLEDENKLTLSFRDNFLGLSGENFEIADIDVQGDDSLKKKVDFVGTSLTYHPNLEEFNKQLDGFVAVEGLLDSEYEVIVSGTSGGDKLENYAPKAGTSVYVVVKGLGDYASAAPVSKKVTVAKKDLSKLVAVKDKFTVEYDSTSDLVDYWDDLADKVVKYYSLEDESCFDLSEYANSDPKKNTELLAAFSGQNKPGTTVTVRIAPNRDVTPLNFTGSKQIHFDIVAEDISANLATALENLEEIEYDGKEHPVNKLLPDGVVTDNDVQLDRDEFTLTVKDGGKICDAGTYTIVLTVKEGAYAGQSAEGKLTVNPAHLDTIFGSGKGVSFDPVQWSPKYEEEQDITKDIKNLKLTFNGKTLQEGVDYKVDSIALANEEPKYGTGIELSFAEITGKCNFKTEGEACTIGKLQKRQLPELPDLPVQTYANAKTFASLMTVDKNGKACTYGALLESLNEKLTLNTHYTAEFLNPMPASGEGQRTLRLKGIGNYGGYVDKVVTITKAALDASFYYINEYGVPSTELPGLVYSHTAALKGLKYTVGNSGTQINTSETSGVSGAIVVLNKKGENIAKDCNFVYENNRAAGTATVKAVGKIGSEVHAVANFEVLPMQFVVDAKGVDGVDETTVAEIFKDEFNGKECSYTGEEVKPANTVVAEDGTYALKENVDYVLSYENNIKVADADDEDNAPALVIKGMGNYTFIDECPTDTTRAAYADNKLNTGIHLPFSIVTTELSKTNVTVNNVTYAGGLEVTPDLTVVNPHSKKALVKDVDYTLELANAVNVDAATAKIKLNEGSDGNGPNYTFDRNDADTDTNNLVLTVNFRILPKNLADCTAAIVDGKIVIKNGDVTVAGKEYDVKENEDGSITATAKAGGNYTGSITANAVKAPEATQAKVAAKTTSSVTVSWDAVEGAEGYTIWYHSEKDTKNARKVLTGGDITSWTHKGLAAGTKYFYTVKAWVKDAEGKYVFGEETSYVRGTTMPMKAKIAKVTAANGMVKVALADEAAGAEKYSMCYSKSSDFASFKVGVRTSYTTRTFTNALTKGTYYVRVKSYRDLGNNKRIYGAWSNTVKVVVK